MTWETQEIIIVLFWLFVVRAVETGSPPLHRTKVIGPARVHLFIRFKKKKVSDTFLYADSYIIITCALERTTPT